MDCAKRDALVRTRTIFINNYGPIFENYSAIPELWWVSVRLSIVDRILSDREIMDIIVQHLESDEFKLSHYDALHNQESLCVSIPVLVPGLDRDDWKTLAIGLAKGYQLDIMAGRIGLDRRYIFNDRE